MVVVVSSSVVQHALARWASAGPHFQAISPHSHSILHVMSLPTCTWQVIGTAQHTVSKDARNFAKRVSFCAVTEALSHGYPSGFACNILGLPACQVGSASCLSGLVSRLPLSFVNDILGSPTCQVILAQLLGGLVLRLHACVLSCDRVECSQLSTLSIHTRQTPALLIRGRCSASESC